MILYLSDEEHEEELAGLNADIHTMLFQHQDMTQVFRKELQYLGAVVLDTPAKMLDRLFNEIINDVINDAENKTHR